MLATELKTLYATDYNQWLQVTTEILRTGKFLELDIDNLIEEIEDLGKSQRQALKSNLRVLLLHLLKWKYQPQECSGSWQGSIREHRSRIQDILEDSPSLKNYYLEVFESCYEKARLQAVDETGLSLETFPSTCQFKPEEILAENYLP